MKLSRGEFKVRGCRLLFQRGIGLTPDGTVFDDMTIDVTRKDQLKPRDRRLLALAMIRMWANFGDVEVELPEEAEILRGKA